VLTCCLLFESDLFHLSKPNSMKISLVTLITYLIVKYCLYFWPPIVGLRVTEPVSLFLCRILYAVILNHLKSVVCIIYKNAGPDIEHDSVHYQDRLVNAV
jgi:hypothetical protein